jgi:hypothetical protein
MTNCHTPGVSPVWRGTMWRDTNGVISDGVGPVSRQSALVQAVLAAGRRFGRANLELRVADIDRGVS